MYIRELNQYIRVTELLSDLRLRAERTTEQLSGVDSMWQGRASMKDGGVK